MSLRRVMKENPSYQVNTDNSLTTMITYDRGSSWQRLPIPTNLPGSCDNPQKCSLQLHISYSVAEFSAATQGPLSIDNATGIIIAHGQVGDSLTTDNVKVRQKKRESEININIAVSSSASTM